MLGLGGRPPTVAEQTASLEADITTTRAEQRSAELNLEQEFARELHALADVDQARAMQARYKRIIGERIEAINSLQDEIAALPRQRQP